MHEPGSGTMKPDPSPGESGKPGGAGGEIPYTDANAYRAVFEEAPDAILLVDARGRILEVNAETIRLFRYEREELVGASVDLLVPEEARGRHVREREEFAEAPRSRRMGVGIELAGRRKDGARIPVEISLSPLRSSSGLITIAIVRDLSENRRLKGFGSGSLQAAEAERGRIARELHDDTAQTLAGLLLRLRVLEAQARDTAMEVEIASLRMELRRAVEGVRRIARGLRPPELEDVGLGAALQAHVREYFPEGQIELTLADVEDPLPPEAGLALYRIAQEALANAARHSGAPLIRLRTERIGPALVLEVEDRGRGFDPDRLEDPGAGLGLLGMQERAELVGAQLEVLSEPGRGTRVRLTLPLQGTPAQSPRGPRPENPDGS